MTKLDKYKLYPWDFNELTPQDKLDALFDMIMELYDLIDSLKIDGSN